MCLFRSQGVQMKGNTIKFAIKSARTWSLQGHNCERNRPTCERFKVFFLLTGVRGGQIKKKYDWTTKLKR